MRAWWIALLVVPLAAAQVAQDPEGDVAWVAAGQDISVAAAKPHLDLRSLEIEESMDAVTFRLHLQDLEAGPNVEETSVVEYWIRFTHDGANLTVLVTRLARFGNEPWYQAVLIEDDDMYEGYRAWADVSVDGDVASVTIQKMDLMGARQVPPSAGSLLEGLHVISYSGAGGSGCARPCQQGPIDAWDRMPDDGVGVFEFAQGLAQAGDLRLGSMRPFRTSNGGAGTYVFDVDAHNAGQESMFGALAVRDVPASWVVSLPTNRVHLEPGGNATLPVLVTTSSQHDHGAVSSFILELNGPAPHAGRIELGIIYPSIPQPSGHHPVVYLHSRDDAGQAFMNALDDDPGDSDVAVPAMNGGGLGPGQREYRWWIPLSPRLDIGLDFDVTGIGTLQATLMSDVPIEGAVLTGTLEAGAGWDGQVVATIEPGEPVELDGEATLEATILVTPEGDYVPYDPDKQLSLFLVLSGDARLPSAAPPSLMPGGEMHLPLKEYHDPLDRFYDHAQSLKFATTYLEKSVNPGKTAIFRTTLHNGDAETRSMQLNVTGTHGDWARILGSTTVSIGAGSQRDVAVALIVPPNAIDGTLVDLVLQARDTQDANRIAVVDLVAFVDTDNDHPDDAGEVDALDASLKERKSPLPWVGLAVVAAAFIARRR